MATQAVTQAVHAIWYRRAVTSTQTIMTQSNISEAITAVNACFDTQISLGDIIAVIECFFDDCCDNCCIYDGNRNWVIDLEEAVKTVNDYFDGKINLRLLIRF